MSSQNISALFSPLLIYSLLFFFFLFFSAVKGKTPQVGDRVLVEAVYNPNMPFKWNAQRIQTLPQLANQTVRWGVVFALYTTTTTLQHLSVFYRVMLM